MKWSERFATGIERIDAQHRMIFQMADDFRTAMDEGRGSSVYALLLDNLTLYCRGHFGFEDQCMEEHRCPVAGLNREAHERFLVVLAGFRSRQALGAYDAAEATALLDTVDSWLSNHICHIDVKLRGDAGAP